MNKILILKAFEKARIEKKRNGIKKPSQTDLSTELSDFIDINKEFSLGERSYRDYYNDAKKLEDEDKDINIKQLAVIEGLCKYIGFNNYQEFTTSIENGKKKSKLEKIKISIKKNKIIISVILIIVIGAIMYNSITQQRWMEWQEDHYVEVKFDAEKLSKGILKIYKEERILYFKQINPDCNTKFFNEGGSENLWYGKNATGNLDYFTDLGLHPETGETLKKITKYMIRTHICNSYK